MKSPHLLPAVVLAAYVGAACTPARAADALPCKPDDKECIFKSVSSSAVRQPAFWREAFRKPVTERIGTAPPELAQFLTLQNMAGDYPNRPLPAALPEDFRRDVKAAFAELPAHILKLFEKRLAGIYFVNDLGGTGFCEYADGGRGEPVGWIALDLGVLSRRTANEWATWKESSPFRPVPGHAIEAIIEKPDADHRKHAIQFILLHELGHILSMGADVHPRWDLPPAPLDKFPFAQASWDFVPGKAGSDGRYASRFDERFSRRRKVVYYFGPQLGADQAAETYEQLAETNFPSLYAATSPGDDFAESFATYVHVVLLKRPWEIRLTVPGKPVFTFRACWDDPRCAGKRRLLEDVLGIKPRPGN